MTSGKKKLLGCLVILITVGAVLAKQKTGPDTPNDESVSAQSTDANQQETLTAAEQAFPVSIAHEMGLAPGAIVCPNFSLVETAYRRYIEAFRQRMVFHSGNAEHQRLMALLYGATPKPSAPDISIYGCTLVPSGTRLHVDNSIKFPAVVATVLSNGQVVRGVTNPAMLEAMDGGTNSAQAPAADDAARASSPSDTPGDTSMPRYIAELISAEERANEQCQDGPEADDSTAATTMAKCQQRDRMVDDLKQKGWCWNVEGGTETSATWSPCK